jgi:hypothetical protein
VSRAKIALAIKRALVEARWSSPSQEGEEVGKWELGIVLFRTNTGPVKELRATLEGMAKEENLNGSSNGASPNGIETVDDILLYIQQATGPYGVGFMPRVP